MAGTGVGGDEGVVWLCEVVAARAGDRSLICHIGDVNRVQDVRLHPSHIQGVGRDPGEEDGASATLNPHIAHSIQQTWTGSEWISSVCMLATCHTNHSSTVP